MDLPPTSRIRFRDLEGRPIGAPVEWQPAFVALAIPDSLWDQARLWCQTERLQVSLRQLNGERFVLADWPRSGTGHYQLRLETPGQEAGDLLTVTVWPTKITRKSYLALLTDLDARLPYAVALALQRLGALAGTRLLPPGEMTMAQELERLRRAVFGAAGRPGMVDILPRLAQDPQQVLVSTRPWVSRQLARRPYPAGLMHALARPHNLEEGSKPKQILQLEVDTSADVYENRLVALYVREIELRLRRLRMALSASESRAEAYTRSCTALDALMRARRQAAFLDEVAVPEHLPDRVSMVLTKRPHYRAAFESYLEFRRTVSVRLVEPALDAPLQNLPYLYQVWCTLQVIGVLLETALERGYSVVSQALTGRDSFGCYVRILPDRTPALVLRHPKHGVTIRLIPEREYGSGSGLHSVSFSQIPDVAIEVESPARRPMVFLLDPKYRLASDGQGDGPSLGAKPIKADIDKMHAYRDSIRDEYGDHVVAFAGIMYPGPYMSYGHQLAALQAYPGEDNGLHAHLCDLLMEVLDH